MRKTNKLYVSIELRASWSEEANLPREAKELDLHKNAIKIATQVC